MTMPFYLRLLMTDRCDVFGYENIRRDDGSTGVRQAPLWRDLPCRLSYDNIKSVYETSSVSHTTQTARLFTPPDIDIPEGSAVTVRRGGVVLGYKSTGTPAVYRTHREYLMEPSKVRA